MSILENVKEVAKAAQEIHNLELYERVLALHSDIIGLVEENNRLRDENKKLLETIALRKVMIFRAPFYYQDGDETPFCPACWEGEQRAAHLMRIHDERWDCPTCKHRYITEEASVLGLPGSSGFSGPPGPNSWKMR